jgi:hypothetical protein
MGSRGRGWQFQSTDLMRLIQLPTPNCEVRSFPSFHGSNESLLIGKFKFWVPISFLYGHKFKLSCSAVLEDMMVD